MVPQNLISAVPQVADFLAPDIDDSTDTQSLELGGIALNDGTQGRQVQVWRAYRDGPDIKLIALTTGTGATVVSGVPTARCIGLGFDSNMQPVVCWIEGTTLSYRWYSTAVSGYVVSTVAGVTSARVTTDDKRNGQEGASDVLVSYTRGGNLYWRTQRENYAVERLVGATGGLVLRRHGMNALGCMQWELAPST